MQQNDNDDGGPMRLSEHFTLEEFIASLTASRLGIDNTPKSEEHIRNMVALCDNILEPARRYIAKPLVILSGYRSPELNAQTPGSSDTSQHCKGQAADVFCPSLPLKKLFWAFLGTDYDQLIWEYDAWIHVSYRENPRRQILRCQRDVTTGKPYYTPMTVDTWHRIIGG